MVRVLRKVGTERGWPKLLAISSGYLWEDKLSHPNDDIGSKLR